MQRRASTATVDEPTAPGRALSSVLAGLRQIRSPLLMLVTVALMQELSRTSVHISPTDRSLVYVVVVAVAAAADGSRKALVCAVLPVAFSAYETYVSRHPDGSDLFLLALSSIAVALVVGDVHARLFRLASALDTEKRQLEETLRARTEFMNAAAHELRTPITVVKGYLSMLHEGSFGPAPHRWSGVLEQVARKAEELGNLVEQMLLSGSLEAGTVASAPVLLDLRDAVRQAAERANPRASLLGATVSYQLPSNSVTVEADPEHVACILDNLINNALSYSDSEPWVRITVMEDGDAQVLVEDRGRGIPEEMRERIFERFVRLRDREHPAIPGTGLGLAISRDFAERQGGSLTLLRSEAGGGSLFVLRLPHFRLTREPQARGMPHAVISRHSR
jgi:two-component system phosphate regulon sensor histidine kinase PhoR